MKIQLETLLVLVHICLILVCLVFMFFGKSHLRKEHIIPLFFVPVVGPLVAVMIEFMILSGKQGIRSPDLEGLERSHDILWTTLLSFREKGDLVPLEEAILINDVKVRRRSMLETLYADPFKYLAVLNVAKYNEDIETSHYATTTISKAQKDFQLSVQKHAIAFECHPDDPEILDAYIEILRKYIKSGLLEENLLKNLRIVYSKALDNKLVLVNDDKNSLTEKLRNAVELQDYDSAFDIGELLRKYWPDDEQSWIETLRVCVEAKDCAQLNKTLKEIQHMAIIWTEHGREQITAWVN